MKMYIIMTSVLRSTANTIANKNTSGPSVGDTKISMKNADHADWLLCDGRSIDKNMYNLLYQVIGTSYGGANMSFNLPNPKGRVLGVVGSGPGLTTRENGDSVGAETHVLTVAELPSLSITTSDAGAHTHSSNCNGGNPGLSLASYTTNNTMNASVNNGGNEPDLYAGSTALTINSAGTHNHTFSLGGNNTPHNNMQPTMFVGNMFIYCGKTQS